MKLLTEIKEVGTEISAEAKKLFEALVDCFATHKSADEVHVTSDGQMFLEKVNADGHGTRLNDKGVATVTRDQIEGAAAAVSAAEPVEGDESLKHPEATEPTPEELAQKALDDKNLQSQLNTVVDQIKNGAAPAATDEAVPAEETVAPAKAKKPAAPAPAATDETIDPNAPVV